VSAPRLAADGDGRGGDNGDREKTTGISPAAGGVGSEGKEKSGGSAGPFSSVQQTWGQLSALWGGFQVPKLEEDDLPEAVALNAALNACKADPSAVPLKKLSAMTGDYYKASYDRIMARPAVKDGLPLIFSVANAGVVLLILRLLLPRLLAIESMNDIYEFAPELGLPSKTELLQYVEYAQNMDYTTKFLIFLLIICVEKVALAPLCPALFFALPFRSPPTYTCLRSGDAGWRVPPHRYRATLHLAGALRGRLAGHPHLRVLRRLWLVAQLREPLPGPAQPERSFAPPRPART